MDIRHADRIADALEELIFTAEFEDNARLDEVRLAERFAVSRTPVREALQRLVASGIAIQIPRRGVFVRQPGPVELLEMFEVMAELEASCGRLAALRISTADIARLETANENCLSAIDAGDSDAYYRENEAFHHLIYKASGNGFLEQEALRLHRRLKPYRRLQLRLHGRMSQSMQEHQRILSALRDGKSDRAATALRDHVAVQGEKFHRLLANLKPAAE